MKDNSDHILLVGKVTDSVHEIFTILFENGTTLKGQLSGKLRFNKIQVIPGDYVELRVSPYDTTHGLIIRRLDNNEVRRIKRF
jgi:translation initiation factor IF-1